MHKLKEIIKYTKDLKLLYVEDNEEARDSVIGILNEFFDDIVVGVDGVDGLEKFKNHDIDLIITDINMPKMSGLEMLANIKKIDEDIISIVFSAYNEAEFFVDSIKLGVEGYLLKPINFEQYISVLEKVTQKFRAIKIKQLLNQYKDVVDNSAIVSIIDQDKKITYVNDAFSEISGYTKDELIGNNYDLIINRGKVSSEYDEIWRIIRNEKKTYKGVLKNISKTGDIYYLDSTIKPILDTKGRIVEYIALRYDITAIMSPLKQLNDLIQDLEIPMIVLVKIENFDNIESFYGQKLTESIENDFAKKLFEFLPKNSGFKNMFHLRNGEYAFVKDRTIENKADEIVIDDLKKFQESINEFSLDIGEIDYDISVIMSLAYGEMALENVRYGIKKLLETKKNFILANNLSTEEHLKAQENIKTLKIVKKAIVESKIISYFQPIINNKTKKIDKYESLVRLIDENENVIPPAQFLNTSKKGKYYSQITSIVLDNSFKALRNTDKEISINISTIDIESRSTCKKLFLLLEEHKDYAHRVVLELLEDEEAKDFNIIKSFIVQVKALGVRIAIDDFGSGYSNFKRLLSYQPDIVKIDGSLIQDVVSDSFSRSTVETIVLFAKAQNIKIIAEFVENEEIFNLLCTLGVDYSQGYYFGKPEPLEYK